MAPADVTAGWCFLLFLLSRSPRPGRGSGQRYGTADGKCERGVRPGVSPTRFRKPERGHGPPSPPSAPCWRLDRPLDSWGGGGWGGAAPTRGGRKTTALCAPMGAELQMGARPGNGSRAPTAQRMHSTGSCLSFPGCSPPHPTAVPPPPPPHCWVILERCCLCHAGGWGGPICTHCVGKSTPPPPRAPCSRAECPLNPPAVVCTAKCCPDGFLPADPRGGPAQTAPRRRAGCRHSCNVMARCCAHTHTHTHTHTWGCAQMCCVQPRVAVPGAGMRWWAASGAGGTMSSSPHPAPPPLLHHPP